MTATERLRAMLDERGVEWRERRYGGESITTMWRALGTEVHYRENRHGGTRMHADSVAPEQAVEATLGNGCSECAEAMGRFADELADPYKAENAKLRREAEQNDLIIETLNATNDGLIAENAKLRELVRTIYMCSCIWCNECEYGQGDDCAFDAEAELRELGVEVDA